MLRPTLSGRARLPVSAALALVVLVGCSYGIPGVLQGSGAVKSEVRSVTDFTKVQVSHGIKLELAIGTPAKVELTAQENLLPIITTTVTGGKLVVDATQNYTTTLGVTAKVTTPALTGLALDGGARGSATGVVASAFTIDTNGGALLDMAGSADSLVINANGGSVVDLAAFTARTAVLSLDGGVVVTLVVTESVTGTADAGVVVHLRGHPPTVNVSTSAGAVVNQE